MENYNIVPNIITGKDLDYLSDMFNWNYGAFKSNLNALNEINDSEIKEIREIIENPTEYFDPDQFDLSELYSDRVIEIGVYKPKFYPFVCPYESCWITGATIETPENGTTKLLIANEEELVELQKAIGEAMESKKSIVNFKDADIDIDDAKFLAETAERQLKQPKKPVDIDNKNDERKVLITRRKTRFRRY